MARRSGGSYDSTAALNNFRNGSRILLNWLSGNKIRTFRDREMKWEPFFTAPASAREKSHPLPGQFEKWALF